MASKLGRMPSLSSPPARSCSTATFCRSVIARRELIPALDIPVREGCHGAGSTRRGESIMKTVVRQTLTATLSRRRLLGAVLATAAIAAPVVATALPGLPVAVTADPDADLIRLVEEWFAARDEEKRLYKLFTPHEEAHFEKKHKLEAQIPDALRVRPDDVEIGIPDLRAKDGLYTRRDDVNLLRDDKWLYSNGDRTESDGVEQFIWRSWWAAPSPAARARADEIIAASDKWQRKIHRKPRG